MYNLETSDEVGFFNIRITEDKLNEVHVLETMLDENQGFLKHIFFWNLGDEDIDILDKHCSNYGITAVQEYQNSAKLYPAWNPHRWVHFPDNVEHILEGQFELVTPTYAEISITTMCNAGCHQCTSGTWKQLLKIDDNTSKSDRMMDLERVQRTVDICSDAGVEAILFAAAGEPTLNKHLVDALEYSKKRNLKTAFYSNGTFNYSDAEMLRILKSTDLFRISLHAVTPEIHASYHRYPSLSLSKKALVNVEQVARLMSQHDDLSTNFGVTNVMTLLNYKEVIPITDFVYNVARKWENGIRFIMFFPEVTCRESDDWGESHNSRLPQKNEEVLPEVLKDIEQHTIPKMNSVGVETIVSNFHEQRNEELFSRCYGTAWYMSEVDSTGNVYFCTQHGGNPDFLIGNIFEETVEEIWSGERRKKLLQEERNFDKCPIRCKQKHMNTVTQNISDFLLRHPKDQLIKWIDFRKEEYPKYEFI